MPQVRTEATIKRHGRLHERGCVIDVSDDELRKNPKLYTRLEDVKPPQPEQDAKAIQQSQLDELERLRNNRRAAAAQLAAQQEARAEEARRQLVEAAELVRNREEIASNAAAEAPVEPIAAEPPRAPAEVAQTEPEQPKLPPHKRGR